MFIVLMEIHAQSAHHGWRAVILVISKRERSFNLSQLQFSKLMITSQRHQDKNCHLQTKMLGEYRMIIFFSLFKSADGNFFFHISSSTHPTEKYNHLLFMKLNNKLKEWLYFSVGQIEPELWWKKFPSPGLELTEKFSRAPGTESKKNFFSLFKSVDGNFFFHNLSSTHPTEKYNHLLFMKLNNKLKEWLYFSVGQIEPELWWKKFPSPGLELTKKFSRAPGYR